MLYIIINIIYFFTLNLVDCCKKLKRFELIFLKFKNILILIDFKNNFNDLACNLQINLKSSVLFLSVFHN